MNSFKKESRRFYRLQKRHAAPGENCAKDAVNQKHDFVTEETDQRDTHTVAPWVPRWILGGKTIGCTGHETIDLNDLFKVLFQVVK